VVSEQALQYFHSTCKPASADMPLAKLQGFMANTNCVAAETHARWRNTKSHTVVALKVDLLVALKDLCEDVVAHCKTKNSAPPAPLERWVDFAAVRPRRSPADDLAGGERGGPHANCFS
jgi:hypothetical protein